MAKERLKYLWWLLIVSFVAISSIAVLFFNMKNAENLMIEYTQAKTCPSIANCRKVIPAKILESDEFWYFIRGRGNSSQSASYTFSIFTSEESKNETVTVVADIPADENIFDTQGVYIPSSSYLYFVKYNFYDNQPIKVETWRNAITFLFVDQIQDPSTIIVITPVLTPTQKVQPLLIVPATRPQYQVAIPTTNNPVVIAKFARRDFWRWGFAVSFLGGCTGLFLLSKMTIKSQNSKRNHDKPN